MPPSSGQPRGIRAFFRRLRGILPKFLFRRTRAAYRDTVQKPTSQAQVKQPSPEIPPSTGVPADEVPSRRSGVTQPRLGSSEEIAALQRRIEDLRRIELEARLEREEIEPKIAAREPPIRDLDDFKRRKGFRYNTWFRAMGTFGELREMGDSPTLLGDMEELEDYSVPAAFFSGARYGKVKWKDRVVSMQDIFDEFGDIDEWFPRFRDIYPEWEYRYYVEETVGDVTVGIFERKAKQPLTPKDRARGWKND